MTKREEFEEFGFGWVLDEYPDEEEDEDFDEELEEEDDDDDSPVKKTKKNRKGGFVDRIRFIWNKINDDTDTMIDDMTK